MIPRICILLLAALMTGCGSQVALAEPGSGRQTRAFAGDCLFRPETVRPAAVGTNVVDAVTGGLISATLGRIGKALRAAGEEDADVIVGRYPAEFEPGNPAKCIFVAKGKWTSNSRNAWTFMDLSNSVEKQLLVASRSLTDPDFFLEVAVERSGGGNALRLVPNYFHYARLIEDKMSKNRNASRGIAFEVAIHPPAISPSGKGAVGASLVLGTMETGYAYDLRTGARAKIVDEGKVNWAKSDVGYLPLEYTSAWFPTFAPAMAKATNPKESKAKQKLPGTVTVTFIETRAPRKFLLFLADVFDASKDEMQKAAEIALIESRKSEADLAATKASTVLTIDFVKRQGAAEVAILTYCKATGDADRVARSSAANVAQRSANLAALAASQPQPYTSFVEVSADNPADSGFCG